MPQGFLVSDITQPFSKSRTISALAGAHSIAEIENPEGAQVYVWATYKTKENSVEWAENRCAYLETRKVAAIKKRPKLSGLHLILFLLIKRNGLELI